MTEQEIERCLERLSTCKTTDVMNFDYAGTLAYIKRLKSENAALRTELEDYKIEDRRAAVKEFAEKFKTRFFFIMATNMRSPIYQCTGDEIDRLVKEVCGNGD